MFAFVRAGDDAAAGFAEELGAEWAGDSAAAAARGARRGDHLRAGRRSWSRRRSRGRGQGGVVVCAGIHMSDIPSFPYELLWGERVLRSVANLTRRDGEDFMELAPRVPVRTQVETHPLEATNEALDRLRAGAVRGAAVVATR